MAALSKLAFNEDEVRVLYALVQHDAAAAHGCPLERQDFSLAGEHSAHETAVATALAKLSDALMDIQERVVASAVKPGQIWADTHHGSKGRTVRVLEVGDTHAQVVVVTPDESAWTDTTGRMSKVSHQDGRGLRGYRLIVEA